MKSRLKKSPDKIPVYSEDNFVSFIGWLLAIGMSNSEIEDAFQRWFGIDLTVLDNKLTIDNDEALKVERQYGEINQCFRQFHWSGFSYADYCRRQDRLKSEQLRERIKRSEPERDLDNYHGPIDWDAIGWRLFFVMYIVGVILYLVLLISTHDE